MRRTILDDGYHNYLVQDVRLVGDPGIPMLVDMHNTMVPKAMVPFDKARSKGARGKYVHFYMHDKYFAPVLTATKKYISLLQEADGVITPDCTMLVGQAKCLLQTSTYFNRAVGAYLQKQGIPVIANIRWSDAESFSYCFLGVPRHSIVAISTHGCIRTQQDKSLFKEGLEAMLIELEPTDVLVHGYMPKEIFEPFLEEATFHRYPSMLEVTHKQEGEPHGTRV